MAGALPAAEFATFAEANGLTEGQIVERFESYAGTTAIEKLTWDLDVHGVNFRAIKGL